VAVLVRLNTSISDKTVSPGRIIDIKDFNVGGSYRRPNPIIEEFQRNPNYFVLPRLTQQLVSRFVTGVLRLARKSAYVAAEDCYEYCRYCGSEYTGTGNMSRSFIECQLRCLGNCGPFKVGDGYFPMKMGLQQGRNIRVRCTENALGPQWPDMFELSIFRESDLRIFG